MNQLPAHTEYQEWFHKEAPKQSHHPWSRSISFHTHIVWNCMGDTSVPILHSSLLWHSKSYGKKGKPFSLYFFLPFPSGNVSDHVFSMKISTFILYRVTVTAHIFAGKCWAQKVSSRYSFPYWLLNILCCWWRDTGCATLQSWEDLKNVILHSALLGRSTHSWHPPHHNTFKEQVVNRSTRGGTYCVPSCALKKCKNSLYLRLCLIKLGLLNTLVEHWGKKNPYMCRHQIVSKKH